MSTTHLQLRKLYSRFWTERDHKLVPPIPLVPKDDPTTLFTGSGMQQLVPYLLGEPHPLGEKLYNIQPCFRSQDIEEIGDNRHTTFFEMMGNWSLGAYFKEEQLEWVWNFFTKELGLPKHKLYVTLFAGTKIIPRDIESASIWKKLGVKDNHIFYYGPDKNWWSRAGAPEHMPPGEPGGPDSEVFYEFTQVTHNPKFGSKCHPNCDCGKFMEICNSVFMQYKKQKNGLFVELPKKNVDFGGGLERILSAMNSNPDVFLTDIFKKIIEAAEIGSGKKYLEPVNKPYLRVIADHLKGAALLIADGVIPSNKDRGYVLRRVLRKAVVKMYQLNGQLATTFEPYKFILKEAIKMYDQIYINSKTDSVEINNVVKEEVHKFSNTLQTGLKQVQKIDKIDGKKAFDLYQTFGFPFELIEELFKEKGQVINNKQFYQEFNKHKALSRTSSVGKFKGGLADHSGQVLKYHTATHLLHQALFDVLGNGVRQEGSNITSERLRFDFSAAKKMDERDLRKVESIINKKIAEKLSVTFKIMNRKEAYKIGARSFFREKYPEKVKVYFIGSASSPQVTYSKEFCGGPHVKNTGEIGTIKIYKYEKIGANLYRIYAK